MALQARHVFTIAAICAVPALAVVAVARGMSEERRSQQTPLAISLPTLWVPFSADSAIRTPHGEQRGKYYRRRDGSTVMALETPKGPLVTIQNTATARMYSHLPEVGWLEHPISPSFLEPPRPRLELPPARTTKLRDQVANGDVYELTGSAKVSRIAVGLNGLIIYSRDPGGLGLEYSNIVVGDPPDDLFLPPSGASVTQKEIGQTLSPESAKKNKATR